MKCDKDEQQQLVQKMLNAQNLTEFEMDQIFLGEKFLDEHVFVEEDEE